MQPGRPGVKQHQGHTLTHASCLRCTYSLESGLLPTSTTPKPGARPRRLVTSVTLASRSDCHFPAIFLPSRIVAVCPAVQQQWAYKVFFCSLATGFAYERTPTFVKYRYGELREGPQHATSMCVDILTCCDQCKALGLQQSVCVVAIRVYREESVHASAVNFATSITATFS